MLKTRQRCPRCFQEIWRIKLAALSGDGKARRHPLGSAWRQSYFSIGGQFLAYMADSWSNTALGVIEEALASHETTTDSIAAYLRRVPSPTLIMRGNRTLGSVLTREWSQWAVGMLPRGEDVYFPAAGHAIHGSSPADFVDKTVRFVAQHSCCAAAY